MGQSRARCRCQDRLTQMKLNDEENDILAGKAGPVPQQALQHQIKVGEFFGAEDFVPVTQAHLMADTESLGEAGVRWLERWPQPPRGSGASASRPSPIRAAPISPMPICWVRLRRCSISNGGRFPRSSKLGVAMTNTCINYQTIQAPTRNEHVAFGDTGVVIYSNSICGARSNFEGGPSALAAGLTGRTPRYGFHLPEMRRATLRIQPDFTPTTLNDWGALGGVIGRLAGNYWAVPVVEGYRGRAEVGPAQAFRRLDGELRLDCAVSPGWTYAGSRQAGLTSPTKACRSIASPKPMSTRCNDPITPTIRSMWWCSRRRS